MCAQGRWTSRSGFFIAVFVAVVWGTTAVYAGGFHHHGTDETAHESCPLCMALLKGFDVPAAAAIVPPCYLIPDVVFSPEVPHLAYVSACPYLRGPPASR